MSPTLNLHINDRMTYEVECKDEIQFKIKLHFTCECTCDVFGHLFSFAEWALERHLNNTQRINNTKKKMRALTILIHFCGKKWRGNTHRHFH